MTRIDYPTGVWSERDGNLLTWGKGDKIKKNRFFATDKITNLSPAYHPMICKAGHDPSLFCSAGSEIVAKILIPEIEACIQFAKDQDSAQKNEEKITFDSAVESGEAFRFAMITEQYGCELTFARRFRDDEKPQYSEWFAKIGLCGYPSSPKIEVDEQAIRQVIGNRQPDGQFCGCTNRAWTISADEWEKIISLSAEIKTKKEENSRAFKAEEAADIQSKIKSGYCFYCENWCYGDCGHYSNDPRVKYQRDFKQAVREANYGIND